MVGFVANLTILIKFVVSPKLREMLGSQVNVDSSLILEDAMAFGALFAIVLQRSHKLTVILANFQMTGHLVFILRV